MPRWDPVTSATVALAVVGGLSFLANVGLGIITAVYAKAARDQVVVEREQLEIMRRQLDVTEKQINSLLVAARPRLSLDVTGLGDRFAQGHVKYVHGTEPAFDLDVWVRTRARLLHARAGGLTSVERSVGWLASEETDFAAPGIPDLADGDAVKDDSYVVGVVTWRPADGERDRSTANATGRISSPSLPWTPPG